MGWLRKSLLGLLILVAAALVGVTLFPPDLFRVGSNYSAKTVCSNVFLANRDPQQVLSIDVQAPGHPMLSLMQVNVDRQSGVVKAGLLGFIGDGLAVHRPGYGCASVPDGRLDLVRATPPIRSSDELDPDLEWPQGELVSQIRNPELDQVLADDNLAGPGVRAIVVVHGGKIVGERYAEGFTPQTPMLGWSMAKTVTATLVGRLVQQNRLQLEDNGLFDHWKDDARANIRLQDLLGMASDLQWNESYGTVSDVTRRLFLEPDMASAATAPPLNNNSGAQIGKNNNYSSGTTVVIARHLQDIWSSGDSGDGGGGLNLARKQLFEPLGMRTAVIEPDARGTLVGGSFMYASARDWARMGQFLLQKGRWQGRQLLPEGYTDWMIQPHPARKSGSFGRGHIWLKPPASNRSGDNPPFPHKAYWMAGHDSQSIAIIPEHDLVIVRMGLTPSKLRYKPAKLANAVIEALQR